jgi:hypothetical protein
MHDDVEKAGGALDKVPVFRPGQQFRIQQFLENMAEAIEYIDLDIWAVEPVLIDAGKCRSQYGLHSFAG